MNDLPILEWALYFAFAAVGLSLAIAALRLLRGPEATDRVLALDTMYINVVAIVVLLGIRHGTELFFEAALLVALLGFASTAALARYLSRGDVIE
jgi:multicomponent K+:H+ antiporter subunit F